MSVMSALFVDPCFFPDLLSSDLRARFSEVPQVSAEGICLPALRRARRCVWRYACGRYREGRNMLREGVRLTYEKDGSRSLSGDDDHVDGMGAACVFLLEF